MVLHTQVDSNRYHGQNSIMDPPNGPALSCTPTLLEKPASCVLIIIIIKLPN
jgi:hypothetical protein